MKTRVIKFTGLMVLLLVLLSSTAYAIDVDNDNKDKFSLGDITIENLSDTGTISTGEEAKIRVSTSYFSSDKAKYEFSVLQDQKETIIRPYDEKNDCVWKPDKPGVYYLTARAKTDSGLSATTSTKVTVVNTQRLQIERINLDQSSGTIETGKTVTITPKVVGGTTPYKYKVIVQNINSPNVQEELTSDNTEFEWTPKKQGTYRIEVEITDSGGQVVNDEISEYNVLANEQEIGQAKTAKTVFFFCAGLFSIVFGILLIIIVDFIRKKREKAKKE